MLQAQKASVQTKESCLPQVEGAKRLTGVKAGGSEEGRMVEAVFRIWGHQTSFCSNGSH